MSNSVSPKLPYTPYQQRLLDGARKSSTVIKVFRGNFNDLGTLQRSEILKLNIGYKSFQKAISKAFEIENPNGEVSARVYEILNIKELEGLNTEKLNDKEVLSIWDVGNFARTELAALRALSKTLDKKNN